MPMIAEPCSSHEWTFVRRAVLIVACLHTAALLAIASVAQARTSPGALKLPNEIEFKAPVNPGDRLEAGRTQSVTTRAEPAPSHANALSMSAR